VLADIVHACTAPHSGQADQFSGVNPLTKSQARTTVAVAAAISSLIALYNFGNGSASLAIVNFGAALFFLFCYENPDLLMIRTMEELDALIPNLTESKFLWVSLAIGATGTGLGLFEALT